MVNMVQITRPERQKAATDEVYRPEGPQARSRGLGAPWTSNTINYKPKCLQTQQPAIGLVCLFAETNTSIGCVCLYLPK